MNTATYTFEETFDVYDADGKLYTYTVAEQGAVTENQVTTIAGKDGAEYGVTYPKQNVTLVDGAAELVALNTPGRRSGHHHREQDLEGPRHGGRHRQGHLPGEGRRYRGRLL